MNSKEGRLAKIRRYFAGLQVVDYRIIISIVFLMMIGLIMIFSATNASDGMSTMLRQAVIGGIGFVLMLILSYVDYHVYAKWAGLIYVAAFLAIFTVRIPGLGVTSHGATRWIQLGSFTFQPSELMKPAAVIVMAYLFTTVGRKLANWRFILIFIVLTGAPVAAIFFVTRNLSTALIVFGIVAVMFFVAHPDRRIWRWVLLAALAAVIGGLIFYNMFIVNAGASDVTSSFRATRILAWLYPYEYMEASQQSRYSLYAIVFGGLLGRGLGNGTVKYYLPEPENDFIFAVIAEELGFVGCLLVIFLFVYQIWRVLTVARHAPDLTGSYMALGFGVHVAIQSLLNIGVATSILPNTGVSLPYISYGGTALLVQLCEMGIVLNISRQIPGRRVAVTDDSAGTGAVPEADRGDSDS